MLLCVCIGILFATLPHVVNSLRFGDAAYFADNDDTEYYLSVASQAYHNHPITLGDPTKSSGGSSVLPWLPLAPGILLAKLFDVEPHLIGLVWRIWAGVMIAIFWYLVVGSYVGHRGAAVSIILVLLADIGIQSSWPIIKTLVTSFQIFSGQGERFFSSFPALHFQWRVMNPGLTMSYLLLHLWLLKGAILKPSKKNILLSGIGFGLLFPTYFYFWTAASLALVISILLDRENRKIYFLTGLTGLVFGSPWLISGLFFKNANRDALLRTDFFVPIARFSEFLIPKMSLILMTVTFIWVWKKKKDYLYLWVLGASALLLTNHQVITGLQIQNFHWSMVYGPVFSLLSLLGIWEIIQHRRMYIKPAIVGVSIIVVLGLWLRFLETTQTEESSRLIEIYRKYSEQKKQRTALESNSIIGGETDFVGFSSFMDNQRPFYNYYVRCSPSVSDVELFEIISIDAHLRGLTQDLFKSEQSEFFAGNIWGPWARNTEAKEKRIQLLVETFVRVRENLPQLIEKFKIKYFVLNAGAVRPEPLKAWNVIQDGQYWTVFQKP